MTRRNKKQQIQVNIKSGKASAATKKNKEVTALGQALRMLGAAGGGAMGSYVGNSMAGGSIGTSLGALVSRWLGQGDYRIARNSLLTVSAANNIPDMHKSGQNVIVRHKEFVLQVNSQTLDTFTTLQINPGNISLFPWLSKFAMSFEQYRIKGMVFHYVPTSGNSSSTQSLGWVGLQTSYRSGAARPSTKAEMLNEYNANEAVPCNSFIHPIECDPNENPFTIHYCNNKPLTADTNTVDALMYNHGDLFIGNGGQSVVGGALGDLWVTYEIELMKPVTKTDRTFFPDPYSYGNVYAGLVNTPTLSSWFNASNLTISNLGWAISGRTVTVPFTFSGTIHFAVQVTSVSPYFTDPVNSGLGLTLNNCTNPSVDSQGNARWSTTTTVGATVRSMHYVVRIDKGVTTVDATVTFPTFTAGSGTVESVNLLAFVSQ